MYIASIHYIAILFGCANAVKYSVYQRHALEYTNVGLQQIPRRLPVTTTILDLHNNVISDVLPMQLRYLTRLTELDLSQNRIGYVGRTAFMGK